MNAVAPTEANVSTKSPHLEAVRLRPAYGAMPFGYCALRDDAIDSMKIHRAHLRNQHPHDNDS